MEAKAEPKAARGVDKAAERRRHRNEKKRQELEDEIASIEKRLKAFEHSLADPAVYSDVATARAVAADRDELKKTLESRIWEWEETSRKLETEVAS